MAEPGTGQDWRQGPSAGGADRAGRKADLRMLAAGACTVIGLEVTVVLTAGGSWLAAPAMVTTALAIVILVWLAADALVVRSSARERERGSGGMTPMSQTHWHH